MATYQLINNTQYSLSVLGRTLDAYGIHNVPELTVEIMRYVKAGYISYKEINTMVGDIIDETLVPYQNNVDTTPNVNDTTDFVSVYTTSRGDV